MQTTSLAISQSSTRLPCSVILSVSLWRPSKKKKKKEWKKKRKGKAAAAAGP